MKLYRTTTYAVLDALKQIFEDKKYADKVIEKVLKLNPKWGARDRRFIAETTYDIVRWYRLLKFVTNTEDNNYWKLLGAWCALNEHEIPDWDEFKEVNRKQILKRYEEARQSIADFESIPDWLHEQGMQELGRIWPEELKALNEEASVVLRVNTLKINRRELVEALAEQEVETDINPGYKDAIILKRRQNVFLLPEFKAGLFEVQDAGSQAIAPFLQAEPGMRVIDACAGGGGKSLHLAALMENKGKIISMDTEEWKLNELKLRARRAGVGNIEIRWIENTKTIKRLDKAADRVLLDVPCSGLGVLKRNPDAKWKLTPEFIENVKRVQAGILNDYATMVKQGGKLVYSTCSIMPSENEKQVENFLKHNSNFALEEERMIWPSHGFDGFYMARFIRKS
ncbi:MAG: RsmB/NOP family class I SAM-dependent RNA methyltransferase [Cyclobacteriaceae bacterium]|nr:RsmB/NOP family class I SAM-dependent RNA methyltransferase [Cyclobacteriaceae bacterium]